MNRSLLRFLCVLGLLLLAVLFGTFGFEVKNLRTSFDRIQFNLKNDDVLLQNDNKTRLVENSRKNTSSTGSDGGSSVVDERNNNKIDNSSINVVDKDVPPSDEELKLNQTADGQEQIKNTPINSSLLNAIGEINNNDNDNNNNSNNEATADDKSSSIITHDDDQYSHIGDRNFTLEDFLSDSFPQGDQINYSFPIRSNCPGLPDNSTLDLSVPNFTRFERVVLVTKIHCEGYLEELAQGICLIHAAYNQRLLYDYIIFHTENITEPKRLQLEQIVYPASVQWVLDSKPLQEEIADLTPEQRATLLQRCNTSGTLNSLDELQWNSRCRDGRFVMPIAYNWMAEFRSKWIWRRPELKPYKYMMWFDADSFSMLAWREDPIEYMIKNKLALLMGAVFGSQTHSRTGVKLRIREAYGTTMCSMERAGTRFRVETDSNSSSPCLHTGGVPHAHGFFHVTDLDFYRLPINLKWGDAVIGDGKYQRIWDDQLAVVVPPAMLAPHRMATVFSVGICPYMLHNLIVMDMTNARSTINGYRAYKSYWRNKAEKFFPEAFGKCAPFIKRGHRRMRM